jgi:hypothetical protein
MNGAGRTVPPVADRRAGSVWQGRIIAGYILVGPTALALGNTGLVPWPIIFVVGTPLSALVIAVVALLGRSGRVVRRSPPVPGDA